MPRTISTAGKQHLKQLEDLRTEVYLDSGGEPTIGIGHLLTRAERRSGKIIIGQTVGDYREGLTVDQCWQLLEQDLDPAENAVENLVKLPLTDTQFDTLVSFTFNVGVEAFTGSTLLKKLNSGDYESVPAQLRRWIFDNGQAVQGLANRREKEIDLWLS